MIFHCKKTNTIQYEEFRRCLYYGLCWLVFDSCLSVKNCTARSTIKRTAGEKHALDTVIYLCICVYFLPSPYMWDQRNLEKKKEFIWRLTEQRYVYLLSRSDKRMLFNIDPSRDLHEWHSVARHASRDGHVPVLTCCSRAHSYARTTHGMERIDVHVRVPQPLCVPVSVFWN